MRCPICDAEDAYVGLSVVECLNPDCRNYVQVTMHDDDHYRGHPLLVLTDEKAARLRFKLAMIGWRELEKFRDMMASDSP